VVARDDGRRGRGLEVRFIEVFSTRDAVDVLMPVATTSRSLLGTRTAVESLLLFLR